MADKETLAARFRAAVERAEADAKKKVDNAEAARTARDALLVDLIAFAKAVGVLETKKSKTGVVISRGEKLIKFDREGDDGGVRVKLSDREMVARYVEGEWQLGEGSSAKPLWDEGLIWLLVNWLDLPTPSDVGAPAPAADPVSTVSIRPKPVKAAAKAAVEEPAPTAKPGATIPPDATKKRPKGSHPGSSLRELKNPWD